MLPDDSNHYGNVHGGVILKMIEENGMISASRHIAPRLPQDKPNPSDKVSIVALARIDRVDFQNPMHIGELAELKSHVSCVGKKSMEVTCTVTAENLLTGSKMETNKARLWYVMIDGSPEKKRFTDALMMDVPKLIVSQREAPPLIYSTESEEKEALERYRALKETRSPSAKKQLEAVSNFRRPDSLPVLSHVVLPSECHRFNTIFGGVVMKLMDTGAAVVAMKHCNSSCVTASLEALNLIAPIYLGNLIRIYAHPTFSSKKSLEVAVYVEAEDLLTGISWRSVSAHLTFVSLDKNGHTQDIPPLVPKTHEERIDFAKGQERYRLRKLNRNAFSK